MSEGVGFYSWTMGILTVICVHCTAPDCRKGLTFTIVPTPGTEQGSIVKGFA